MKLRTPMSLKYHSNLQPLEPAGRLVSEWRSRGQAFDPPRLHQRNNPIKSAAFCNNLLAISERAAVLCITDVSQKGKKRPALGLQLATVTYVTARPVRALLRSLPGMQRDNGPGHPWSPLCVQRVQCGSRCILLLGHSLPIRPPSDSIAMARSALGQLKREERHVEG